MSERYDQEVAKGIFRARVRVAKRRLQADQYTSAKMDGYLYADDEIERLRSELAEVTQSRDHWRESHKILANASDAQQSKLVTALARVEELEQGAEPFAYCFTDVNGRPSEFCDAPVHAHEQDKRIRTPLYTHPPSARVEALEGLLERSANALLWYKDAHPDDWSEADEEHRAAIDAALAREGGDNG